VPGGRAVPVGHTVLRLGEEVSVFFLDFIGLFGHALTFDLQFAPNDSFLAKLSEIRLAEIKCLSTLMQVRGFIYSTSSVNSPQPHIPVRTK
jgi:hypothetical protein